MGQGEGPELWGRVKDVDPPALAAGDLGAITLPDQVRGVPNGPVARLSLSTLLHLHRHHGVMTQVDDDDVTVLDVVRILHKTHVGLSAMAIKHISW